MTQCVVYWSIQEYRRNFNILEKFSNLFSDDPSGLPLFYRHVPVSIKRKVTEVRQNQKHTKNPEQRLFPFKNFHEKKF